MQDYAELDSLFLHQNAAANAASAIQKLIAT
jgi:hypothetical protein